MYASCQVLMGCYLDHWEAALYVLVRCVILVDNIVAMVMYQHGASAHILQLSLFGSRRNGKFQQNQAVNILKMYAIQFGDLEVFVSDPKYVLTNDLVQWFKSQKVKKPVRVLPPLSDKSVRLQTSSMSLPSASGKLEELKVALAGEPQVAWICA